MNHTAEEVRETERILRKHSNGPGTFDYEASDMLNAYADMIESVQGEAWSHRMATKEAGQYVCAGAHGIPNTPAPTAEPVAQGDVTAMSTALKAIKLRLHFMHWPSEAMWNAGTQEAPIWVPDWRYEIALLEHALHGTPVTVAEKPGDTVPRHSLAAQPHSTSAAEPVAHGEAAKTAAMDFETWLREVDDLYDKHLAKHDGRYIAASTHLRHEGWRAALEAIDLAAVREVIAHLRDTDETYLADKLEAAIQEKGNG